MPLTGQITLRGESGQETFERTFVIMEQIGDRGGSAISYKAHHDEGAPGVLKEFYPEYFIGNLKRDSEGQLICPDEFRRAFYEARDEYIWPYIELMSLMHNTEHDGLGTFIPSFEIYYGKDTAYIWTSKRGGLSVQ